MNYRLFCPYIAEDAEVSLWKSLHRLQCPSSPAYRLFKETGQPSGGRKRHQPSTFQSLNLLTDSGESLERVWTCYTVTAILSIDSSRKLAKLPEAEDNMDFSTLQSLRGRSESLEESGNVIASQQLCLSTLQGN